MADKEKSNWLVELMTFVFSFFVTGNDRLDRGIKIFVTSIMVFSMVLGMLAMLFWVMDTTLPVISDSIGETLRGLLSPILNLFSSADAVNQLPPPAGGEAVAIDIPVN